MHACMYIATYGYIRYSGKMDSSYTCTCNYICLFTYDGAQTVANPTPIPPKNLPVKISNLNIDLSVTGTSSVRMISNHPMVQVIP